ncbi:Alpha/Beta hydrolase protein [Aspergillus egyptiacus]|nr:Alpha/Beta hydrolase protein [Aspergillus egyptiacus]
MTARCRHYLPPRSRIGTREFFTESIPPILLPPVIFTGLLLALWTWKCFWIVVLQDKLLYLSWLPPLSRSESISDYAREFRGVQWTEKQIRSSDGTKLAVCEGRFPSDAARRKRVVICYFQGNGGSTPLRLPLLSQFMKSVRETDPSGDVQYVVVALSYRGYWKSAGRATQRGIELDAQAFLNWVAETYVSEETDLRVVLWGHSLGAAVASSATVKYLADTSSRGISEARLPIKGLILEAPISSIKDMLISLYPQKWLPYRYLWPFSWNNWDVAAALEELARSHNAGRHEKGLRVPPIFLMSAESDEVIPLWVADQLEEKAKSVGLDIQRKNVKGAMHIEGPLKEDGRKALVKFVTQTSTS